jgi:hypothetical protein
VLGEKGPPLDRLAGMPKAADSRRSPWGGTQTAAFLCVAENTRSRGKRHCSHEKTRIRKYGTKALSEAQTAYNWYVIAVASITDASAELLLDLHRQRRRIELAFKWLKPLFKRHETPVHVERSAPPWFYGRLLLAAICEAWASEGRFPSLI